MPDAERKKSTPTAYAAACCLATGLLSVGATNAGDWTITPALTLQETATDNVTLDVSDGEDGDFVTDASPSVLIVGGGRRFNVDAEYRLQNLVYAAEPDFNQTNHLFRGESNVELLEDWLFLDLNARARPQNVSSFGRVALDNVSITDNRDDVLSYAFSPYWQGRYRNLMDAEIRYRYDVVEFDERKVSNSKGYEYVGRLQSGSALGRFPWRIDYRNRRIAVADRRDSKFETIQGQFSYALTRQYHLLATIGWDENDFPGVDDKDSSGEQWSIGGRWTPNGRTTVEGRVGHRFFGTTGYASVEHQMRRLRWTLSYSEEPMLAREGRIADSIFTNTDVFGEPIAPGDRSLGDPGNLDGNPVLEDNQVFVNEALNATARYVTRRTSLSALASVVSRTYQATGENEDVLSIGVNWRRRLSRAATFNASVRWSDSNLRRDFNDELLVIEPGFHYQLGRNLEARIEYRFTDRSSNSREAEYQEHRLSANVIMSL